LHFNQT